MSRQAVALGTPRFATWSADGGLRVRRDPRELVKLLLSAAA
jgi:hypothetical protein